jgi:hypothetical protein
LLSTWARLLHNRSRRREERAASQGRSRYANSRGGTLITKDDMMNPMLTACPSFRSAWDAFVEEWKDDAEGLPHYLVLADLARHLVDMLARNDTASFPVIFDVVEEWHLKGDSYVKEAATVGLLEDLQNTNLHESTKPEQFRVFLGPVSAKWWDKLYGFWERGELLRE